VLAVRNPLVWWICTSQIRMAAAFENFDPETTLNS
jgi:hypothetical protein